MTELRGIIKALDADNDNCVIDIEDVPDEIAERGHYICLLCGSDLIAKKGTKRMHHFAHRSATECDDWATGMTEWHLMGQRILEGRGAKLETPFANIDNRGHRHRLDALMTDGDGHRKGFELQHSPMGRDMFDVRNRFYLDELDELIWVFDVRGRDIRLGREFHPAGSKRGFRPFVDHLGRWMRQPEWFSSPCLEGWYGRMLSVFLYVDGGDDWPDGRIVEVVAPELAPDGHGNGREPWLGRSLSIMEWLDEVTGRGSFAGRRRTHVLTYMYHDGTTESLSVRYGMRIPLPSRDPSVPEGKDPRWPAIPRRIPDRNLVLRQELTDRMCSVRITGSGRSVTVPYGSDRGQVWDAVRTGLIRCRQLPMIDRLDMSIIPPVLRDDLVLRPSCPVSYPAGNAGRMTGWNGQTRRVSSQGMERMPSGGSSRRPAPSVSITPLARPTNRRVLSVGSRGRHKVTVLGTDGTSLGFVTVDDGTDIRDAVDAVRQSLVMFGTTDGHDWDGIPDGRVHEDVTVTLRRTGGRRKVTDGTDSTMTTDVPREGATTSQNATATLRIVAQGGTDGDIDLSVPVTTGTPLSVALCSAKSSAGRAGDAYIWEIPQGNDLVDGDMFVRLAVRGDGRA